MRCVIYTRCVPYREGRLYPRSPPFHARYTAVCVRWLSHRGRRSLTPSVDRAIASARHPVHRDRVAGISDPRRTRQLGSGQQFRLGIRQSFRWRFRQGFFPGGVVCQHGRQHRIAIYTFAPLSVLRAGIATSHTMPTSHTQPKPHTAHAHSPCSLTRPPGIAQLPQQRLWLQ